PRPHRPRPTPTPCTTLFRSNSPVGSRMAIMLGGAAAGAAKTIKETLIAIAAHNFECSPEDLEYHDGSVNVKGAPSKEFSWDQLRAEEHRSELQSRGQLVCRL